MENTDNTIVNNKPPVYEGDDDFILISYSHKDKELVYQDMWDMINAGVNVWYDDGIIAGNRWDERVEEHIKMPNCKHIILFVSENYVDSDAIKREIEMIKKYNKSYFAVNLGGKNINELVAHALYAGTMKIENVQTLAEFLNNDVLHIDTKGNIGDRTHIDEIIRQISNVGIKVKKDFVNQMNTTKKVFIVCKNSSFSRSIISGICDYMAKKNNIVIEKKLIDNSLNKVDASLELYDELLKHKDDYDGFMIRPIEKYDEKLKLLIKCLIENGKKVVLLDINMTEQQLEEFEHPPIYIGSDFYAGGRAIGERMCEITRKIGASETKVILFGGPFGNISAKNRCDAIDKIVKNEFSASHIYSYVLPSFSEELALADILNYSKSWDDTGEFREQNVIIYCGNDNIAVALMRILSKKNVNNVIYSALKDCKKIILVGYDGIRDINNEIVLKNYGIDYITVDVVPFKQGVDAGKAISELLLSRTGYNEPFLLTQPELIENISFPTEKYDNISDVQYIFKNKKLILFDLDGTIADTEPLHWMAYNKLLEAYDVRLNYDEIKNYIGHSELSIYKSIKTDFNIDFDNEDFLQNRIEIYLDLVKERNLRPYKFICEILEKYKDKCKFVMITSQIPHVVNTLIDLWHLREYFPEENVFCCHDGKYKKEAIYKNVNAYLGDGGNYNPKDVLLLEDSEHYMSIAKEIGFSIIGVEHKHNLNTLYSCDAIMTKNATKGLFVGLCGMDVIYYGMSQMPKDNTKKKLSNFIVSIGGPAANAAVTYSMLGGQSYLISTVGNNEIGIILKRLLEKYNVRLIDIANDVNHESNISAIYVNVTNGERTILSGQSVRKFKPEMSKDFQDKIKKCKFTLYDGNLLGVESNLVQYLEYYKKDLVIDAGSYKEGFKECFAVEPTVISSETFTDKDGLDVFELSDKFGFKYAAKTRGENTVQFIKDNEIGEIPSLSVKAIDTLGAGDIFHGAYCFFKYVKKYSFEDALNYATQFASYSTCKKGVIDGILYAKEQMIDYII